MSERGPITLVFSLVGRVGVSWHLDSELFNSRPSWRYSRNNSHVVCLAEAVAGSHRSARGLLEISVGSCGVVDLFFCRVTCQKFVHALHPFKAILLTGKSQGERRLFRFPYLLKMFSLKLVPPEFVTVVAKS